MSSYTMTVKEMLDMWTIGEASSTRERIEKGRKKLFDFDYPIFDEQYRNVFETNFIRNFYMREIGFETEGLFKFQLETWLLINMPYFNKLFESETLTFDIFSNVKMGTTLKRERDRKQDAESRTSGNSEGEINRTGNSENDKTGQLTEDNFEREIKSDTPDTRLNLTTNDGQGILEYASNINEDTENNRSNSTSNETASHTEKTTSKDNTQAESIGTMNINDIEDYVQSKVGKSGNETYAEMLQKYRSALLRIEKTIHTEMQQLFMGVY